MSARTFTLTVENGKAGIKAAWGACCEFLELGTPVEVTVKEYQSTRSKEQNAKMWACLTDISNQVDWPVDGIMQKLSPEEWKTILTAGLVKEQRIAQGISGGFVMLGRSTSKMKVKEMIELIEFILWFGADRGVVWKRDG